MLQLVLEPKASQNVVRLALGDFAVRNLLLSPIERVVEVRSIELRVRMHVLVAGDGGVAKDVLVALVELATLVGVLNQLCVAEAKREVNLVVVAPVLRQVCGKARVARVLGEPIVLKRLSHGGRIVPVLRFDFVDDLDYIVHGARVADALVWVKESGESVLHGFACEFDGVLVVLVFVFGLLDVVLCELLPIADGEPAFLFFDWLAGNGGNRGGVVRVIVDVVPQLRLLFLTSFLVLGLVHVGIRVRDGVVPFVRAVVLEPLAHLLHRLADYVLADAVRKHVREHGLIVRLVVRLAVIAGGGRRIVFLVALHELYDALVVIEPFVGDVVEVLFRLRIGLPLDYSEPVVNRLAVAPRHVLDVRIVILGVMLCEVVIGERRVAIELSLVFLGLGLVQVVHLLDVALGRVDVALFAGLARFEQWHDVAVDKVPVLVRAAELIVERLRVPVAAGLGFSSASGGVHHEGVVLVVVLDVLFGVDVLPRPHGRVARGRVRIQRINAALVVVLAKVGVEVLEGR